MKQFIVHLNGITLKWDSKCGFYIVSLLLPPLLCPHVSPLEFLLGGTKTCGAILMKCKHQEGQLGTGELNQTLTREGKRTKEGRKHWQPHEDVTFFRQTIFTAAVQKAMNGHIKDVDSWQRKQSGNRSLSCVNQSPKNPHKSQFF